jgi:hypothetical protein
MKTASCPLLPIHEGKQTLPWIHNWDIADPLKMYVILAHGPSLVLCALLVVYIVGSGKSVHRYVPLPNLLCIEIYRISARSAMSSPKAVGTNGLPVFDFEDARKQDFTFFFGSPAHRSVRFLLPHSFRLVLNIPQWLGATQRQSA